MNEVVILAKIRKYAVFGFIREQTKLLLLPAIQTLIDYVCLSYYSETDHFNKLDNNKMKLSANQMTVTSDSDDRKYRPVFGYCSIDSLSSKHYEWKFKINENKNGMDIGLQRDEEDPKWAFI